MDHIGTTRIDLDLDMETNIVNITSVTTQKIKFPIKDFFSKCDQIRRKLRIWSHLLKKSLTENFNFLCSVSQYYDTYSVNS